MEKRFKLRFSRIFQASFFSCRSRKHSDIIDKAISAPRNHRSFHLIEQQPISTTNDTYQTSISSNQTLPRRKVSEKFSPFLAPPASPVSPFKAAPLCELRDCLSRQKKKKKKKKKKNSGKIKQSKRDKKTNRAEEKNNEMNDFGGAWWYSGEDDDDDTEDETETLFSSWSLTSDSSVSRRRRRIQRESRRRSERSGVFPLEGKVKDSFAVVKNSTDPYKDFRSSMAEMIVEKEIFGEKELEQLLQCFLSLNSRHYHKVILEVYSEIKEALFYSHLGFRS